MSISSHNAVSGIRPVNAAQPLAKRTDPREAAPGAGVPADKGQPEVAPKAEGHARLDAFSKKIESRFENALNSQKLSPRQREALEQERDRFQSLIARFESAYLDGAEGPRKDATEGIQKLLQNFSKSVNHIVSGGVLTKPDDGTAVPTAGTSTTSGARGKIDLVG